MRIENKHPFVQLLILIALWFGCALSISGITLGFVLFLFGSNSPEITVSYLWLTQSLSSVGMFFLPAIFFSYLKTGSFFGYFSLGTPPPSPMAGKVALLSFVVIPVVAVLAYVNEKMTLPETLSGIEQWMRNMEDQSAELLELMTNVKGIGGLLMNLVVMAMVPAVTEEFFFRGTMQSVMGEWVKNKHSAIWITAFIFSVIHFQFYGFIPRFLLGAYLGYLLLWSRSLWLPILAHLLHNALSIIFDFLAKKADYDLESLDPSDVTGFIPISITVFVLFGLGIYSLYKSSDS
ncbi:MAG: CPBP family intramembrane metalloprotease [Bacteroidales bacterium]|jgi:membrane protease YdiL (CAAX protease family)|nr:CPBP family intramembrane metalloprotease [Bacteroidales bacterium]